MDYIKQTFVDKPIQVIGLLVDFIVYIIWICIYKTTKNWFIIKSKQAVPDLIALPKTPKSKIIKFTYLLVFQINCMILVYKHEN